MNGSCTSKDEYDNYHYEWDTTTLPDFDFIKITLMGEDMGKTIWRSGSSAYDFHGTEFQGMHLYLSPPSGSSLMLA